MCERFGLSPQDGQRLAELEKAGRRWQQSLIWAEKGLALSTEKDWCGESAYGLDALRIDLLRRLGRKDEALAQAWDAFTAAPHVCNYEELMRQVPKPSEWEATVLRVHAEHRRKQGFLSDFGRVATGKLVAEPTFNARIRDRLKTIAGGRGA